MTQRYRDTEKQLEDFLCASVSLCQNGLSL